MNPLAPKVPKHDRLGSTRHQKMVLIVDSLRICGNLRILHIGTRSSKFTVSTWGQLWPTRPQLGPNLDPTRAMLCLGTSPAQVELHVGSTWRTWPTQYEVVKNAFHWHYPCLFGIDEVARC